MFVKSEKRHKNVNKSIYYTMNRLGNEASQVNLKLITTHFSLGYFNLHRK